MDEHSTLDLTDHDMHQQEMEEEARDMLMSSGQFLLWVPCVACLQKTYVNHKALCYKCNKQDESLGGALLDLVTN